MRFISVISKYIFPLLLITITSLIAFLNFEPHTWLTGWDTLHPEFDFALNFKRLISGVWRSDQGLGALAAHSHMSELPRVIILWLLSLFFPLESLRYLFVFLCFVLGPLGIYSFTQHIVSQSKATISAQRTAGFIAGLIYIFNLGTVQHFYVEFEMFVVQYAALGWLFWLATLYQEKGTKKHLLLYTFAISLAAPMAYASLLWFAFFAALILYLSLIWFIDRSKNNFKRACLIGLVTVGVNAYWLLPNLYFLISPASQFPESSHINRLFSPESFYHNRSYGQITDVVIVKNFLFNWLQYNTTQGMFQPLMPAWQIHLNNPFVLIIGYSLFFLSLLGMIRGIKQKNSLVIALGGVGFLSLFALINMNFPFTTVFSWLREHSSLFKEGLRTPFTKFSILYMMVLAVCGGYAIGHFIQDFKNRSRTIKNILPLSVASVFFVLLSFYCLPMYQGHLLDSKLRNKIPSEYFSFFEFMKTQPKQARLLQLPIPHPVGWEYYNWDYEGAGFIWFGIPQAVSVRDFDRWQPANETLYQKLSTALYQKNDIDFFSILEQYDIDYLLVDTAVISPGQKEEYLEIPTISSMLRSQGVQPVWTEGSLSVFRLSSSQTSSYVNAPPEFRFIASDSPYNRLQTINGAMIDLPNQIQEAYPFSGLTQNLLRPTSLTTKSTQAGNLSLPEASEYPYTTRATAAYTNNSVSITFSPSFRLKTSQTELSPNIQSFSFELSDPLDNPDKVLLQFASNEIILEKNNPESLILSLPYKKDFEILVSDLDTAQVIDNSLIVDAKLTQSFLATGLWSEFSDPISIAAQEDIIIEPLAAPVFVDISKNMTSANCSLFGRGTAKKSKSADGVVYTAEDDATACETFYPDISNQVSYLLSIKYHTDAGRPAKIYLRNLINNRLDLEELLPEDSDQVTYSILSWPKLEKSEYGLTLETRAFRNIAAQTTLQSIAFTPLPVEVLSVLRLVYQPSTAIINDLSLEKIVQLNDSFYQVQGTTGVTNYVTLSQSYDDDWIAFSIAKPWIFLPHYRYNSWANAWIIPTTNNPESSSIILMYWPQLLQTGGFIMLITTFILVLKIRPIQESLKPKFKQSIRKGLKGRSH